MKSSIWVSQSFLRALSGLSAALVMVGLNLACAGDVSNQAKTETNSSGPQYASAESQEIIEKMVQAHGGLTAWRSAPSVRFDSHLKVNFGEDNWVSFWEEACVDPASRCAYAVLPNPDGTSGQIAFDGTRAWSAGDLRGIAQAPPRFTAWRNFYLFNLPWMTQDEGVILSEPREGTMPIDDQTLILVDMTFETGTGDTPRDYYTLYIDPETYRIHAAEYVMTYAAFMQPGKTESPPSVFVWDETETVEGLEVLTRYTVYWSGDGSVAVKDGEITNWSFSGSFDESRLEMPENATLDESSPIQSS